MGLLHTDSPVFDKPHTHELISMEYANCQIICQIDSMILCARAVQLDSKTGVSFSDGTDGEALICRLLLVMMGLGYGATIILENPQFCPFPADVRPLKAAVQMRIRTRGSTSKSVATLCYVLGVLHSQRGPLAHRLYDSLSGPSQHVELAPTPASVQLGKTPPTIHASANNNIIFQQTDLSYILHH